MPESQSLPRNDVDLRLDSASIETLDASTVTVIYGLRVIWIDGELLPVEQQFVFVLAGRQKQLDRETPRGCSFDCPFFSIRIRTAGFEPPVPREQIRQIPARGNIEGWQGQPE
jgi:hypothetical protein